MLDIFLSDFTNTLKTANFLLAILQKEISHFEVFVLSSVLIPANTLVTSKYGNTLFISAGKALLHWKT